MFDKVNICGININNVSMRDAINAIERFIIERHKVFIVTPNADHIVKLHHDREFRELYKNAALVLADGMPLLWASRYLGTPLKEKISGSDLFPKMCEVSAEKGYRIFFLGGRPGAAVKASRVLKDKYPKLRVTGMYSPPFGFENDMEENAKIVKSINESGADILFVGLGAPKQEKWIYKYKDEYQVPVSIGIGVSFEFVSGFVKRAPVLMQKTGFEWFWRLIHEPKRLWKRYLVHDIKFFWLVLKQKYNKSNSRN